MTQSWHDLLFAHWPVDVAALRRLVPPALPIDTFDGQAWVAVVPFHMTNVSPRGVPALPFVSAFPELNVRTYVTVDGKPGVYFFSLDAGSRAAVMAARALFRLPYFAAAMTVSTTDGVSGFDNVRYSSRRNAAAEFVASYRPTASAREPKPGTLEYFLTERYCLYTVNRRSRPRRLEIDHPPWPLQIAEAEIVTNTVAQAAGITLPPVPPLLHFAKRQDVVAWWPQRA